MLVDGDDCNDIGRLEELIECELSVLSPESCTSRALLPSQERRRLFDGRSSSRVPDSTIVLICGLWMGGMSMKSQAH